MPPQRPGSGWRWAVGAGLLAELAGLILTFKGGHGSLAALLFFAGLVLIVAGSARRQGPPAG